MNRAAITQGDAVRLALCVAAVYVADRWFDIPAVFSIPSAFLGALVYGYVAVERSARRKAALMAAARAAWDDVEVAALDLREAEGDGSSVALIAGREEAYAAALDRAAIVAKSLADYSSIHAAGAAKTR